MTWEKLSGSGKTRYCDICRKNVHNLSALTAAERTNLLRNSKNGLCVAYLRDEKAAPRKKAAALIAAATAGSLLLTAACSTPPKSAQPTTQESKQEKELLLSAFMVGGI